MTTEKEEEEAREQPSGEDYISMNKQAERPAASAEIVGAIWNGNARS